MADKVTIAELDLNTEALVAAAAETKKTLTELSEANKTLKKSTSDTTAEQVKNEAAIKKLKST